MMPTLHRKSAMAAPGFRRAAYRAKRSPHASTLLHVTWWPEKKAAEIQRPIAYLRSLRGWRSAISPLQLTRCRKRLSGDAASLSNFRKLRRNQTQSWSLLIQAGLNITLPSPASICGLCILLLTELVIGRQAHAQTYPAKPIRFILSYPPGGSTDTLGRIVAKVVSDAEGVNVIADNRPGASGSIGTSLCAKSPPDGYTMCMV